jgi:outer membrane protein
MSYVSRPLACAPVRKEDDRTMRILARSGRRTRAVLLALGTSVTLICAGVGGLWAGTPTPDAPGHEVALTPPAPMRSASPPVLPPELLRPGATFTLAQVVDVALSNSPLTRASYGRARSAAADLGSKRGAYLPQIDASGSAVRAKQPQLDGSGDVALSTYGPAVTLNYLLFDFGGRGGKVEEARQNLLAADWQHNATIHDVAFGVQQAYFDYLTAKAQLAAARRTFDQAQASLDAANTRHDAGVATIADVLQARTALAQAQLNVEGLDGQVLALRGALATAMGLPADVPLDIGSLPSEVPLDRARSAVAGIISDARLNRPDLTALRAQAAKAAAHVDSVRAEGLPSLGLRANANRTYYRATGLDTHLDSWSAGVQLSVPLFYGFSKTYDLRRAREDAAVALAQAESYEQLVILQVWTGYYGLETATQRVRTSQALLQSATQSEQVALARYKEGAGTVLDLLSAQAALANARAQEIQSRADWFVAVARLAHDSGRLMPSSDVAVVTEEKKEK